MLVAEHPSSRMHIEEERGDLLIDILKNLPQRGQYVRENMPDEKGEGGESESESEGETERKEESMKESKSWRGRKGMEKEE